KRYDLMNALADALLGAGEPKRVSDEVAPEMFAIAERMGGADQAAWVCWLATEALARQDAGPVFGTPEFALWVERMYRHSLPGTRFRVTADIGTAWTHYAFRRLDEFWAVAAKAVEDARRVGHTETLAQAIFT